MRALYLSLIVSVISMGALGCDSSEENDSSAPTIPFRVSVIARLGDSKVGTTPMDLGGVEVCQGTRCTRANLVSENTVADASNDIGITAGTVVLPSNEAVTSIRVLPNANGRAGGLVWADVPVELARPFAFAPQSDPDGNSYVAGHHAFIVMDSMDPDGVALARYGTIASMPNTYDVAMMYESARGSSMELDGGVSVRVEPGGTSLRGNADDPMIFGYTVLDGGAVGPTFQAYSSGAAETRAVVRLPLDVSRLPEGASMSDLGVRVDGIDVSSQIEGNAIVVEVGRFETIQVGLSAPYVEDAEGRRVMTPDGSIQRAGAVFSNACSNALAGRRAYYEDYLLNTSATVYSNICVSSDPALHVVIGAVFGYKAQGGTGYAVRNQMTPASGGNYSLLKLDEHVANFNARSTTMVAAINGFQWFGRTSSAQDAGQGPGGLGVPRGTVHWDGTRVSTGASGGEAIVGFSARTSGSTNANLFRRLSGSAPSSSSMAPNNYTAIGSTTSLLVSGSCTGTSAEDWHSAIGYGNGYVMMLSSEKSSELTAGEMCDVFRAMGMTTAILLDGSSAATLAFNGTVRNFNTGTRGAYWGPVRRIAYGIGLTS